MPHQNLLVCLLITLGMWGTTLKPVQGQALVPHVLQLDSAQLEQTGLGLAEEALQLARFQQFDLALSRAELATELAPNNQRNWELLGGLYIKAEKLEESIYALKKAQELNPSPDVHFILGRVYFEKSDYKNAIQELRKGLKFKPENSEALFNLGNAYYKHGKFKRAITQYEQAYDLEKKEWPAMAAINNIGLVQYEMGKVDDAIAKWRQAISIESEAAEPLLAIAVALYAQGDKEQSLAKGEEALLLDSRYADIDYLEGQLWGKRLIEDAKIFLATPRIQKTLAKIEED
ncbi:MAG: tetratricopeptide repeat protein [Trichodesmium sp. St16_bin4-tuft]|nr:tetratricopeptide repeat protein [Trichodesmium sp. St5_bin8]MDE5100617.1 tetratricopeptide repeat protein [Trichodesmium sp. St16_bin4-tuft]